MEVEPLLRDALGWWPCVKALPSVAARLEDECPGLLEFPLTLQPILEPRRLHAGAKVAGGIGPKIEPTVFVAGVPRPSTVVPWAYDEEVSMLDILAFLPLIYRDGSLEV